MKTLVNLLLSKEYVEWKPTDSHKDILKTINIEDDFFSVIISQQYIDSDIHDNPKLIKKTPFSRPPLVDETARAIVGEGTDFSWVIHMLRNHYPDKSSSELADDINKHVDGYVRSFYIEAFDSVIMSWALDKTGAESLSDEEFADVIQSNMDEYIQLKTDVFLPVLDYDIEVLYENYLPKPLNTLTCRDLEAQFYFKKSDGVLTWVKGSEYENGAIFNHGYFGHLFAEIQNRLKPVRVYYLEIDSKCNVKVGNFFWNLFLLEGFLTKDYKIDENESDEILDGVNMVERQTES